MTIILTSHLPVIRMPGIQNAVRNHYSLSCCLYPRLFNYCHCYSRDFSANILSLTDFLSKRETTRSLPQCQQEADGRLLAHDTHAIEEGQEGVVVYPENTDVFMMALAFYNNIRAFLLQKCGPKTRTRVINIRNLSIINICIWLMAWCRWLLFWLFHLWMP